MNTALHVVSSTSTALTTSPTTLAAVPDYGRTVRVFASVSARIAVGGTAGQSDLPIAENGAMLVDLPAGVTLSAVKGADADDGVIWFTTVKRV